MTHHAGFLQDIIEHPEEDAPRLIYADWLTDNGDPGWAEFIRVQCELSRSEMKSCACFPSRWPGQTYVCQGCILRGRERELLEAQWEGWGRDFHAGYCANLYKGQPFGPNRMILFRRGFVAEITLPCRAWLEHGPALVRAAPLEKVKLSDKWPGDGEEGGWGWAVEDSDEAPPWRLPDCLATRLDPRLPRWVYPSPEAAQDAISRACLKWARGPIRAVH